jgi:MFS family permease
VAQPTSVLSRELLPASIAIYTTVALVAFEGLAVVAALPQVAADLGNVALLPWVITSFLLMSGIATVTAGPLVDAVGVQTMFRVAVVVFTVGGVAAGFVPTMPLLIVARVLQGIGGGLVIATGLAGVSLVFPDHLVGRAFAANSTVWGVMGVAGPAIAAFMLTALSWRWIFLVNLPLGLLALLAGWRALPGPPAAQGRRRPDAVGVILVLGFNVALLLAVDRLGSASVLWFLAALALAAVYRWHAKRSEQPVMRLRHLLFRPLGPLAMSLALALTGAFAANAFIPLYVQGGRGGGPGLTAWSVLFFTIGWTAGSNLSPRLLDRMADTSVMGTGFAFTIPSLMAAAALALADAPLPAVFAVLFTAGVGIGISTNAGLTLLRSFSPSDEIGRATSAHQFYRNLGFTLGAAIGGSVILAFVGRAVGDVEAVRSLLSGDASSASGDAAAAIADGFAATAAVGSAIAMTALAPFFVLRRHLAAARTARNASGRRPAR